MHVWILNHYAVPAAIGGWTRHAFLARFLQEKGHKGTIFASATHHGQESTVDNPGSRPFADQEYEGVPFRRLRHSNAASNRPASKSYE